MKGRMREREGEKTGIWGRDEKRSVGIVGLSVCPSVFLKKEKSIYVHTFWLQIKSPKVYRSGQHPKKFRGRSRSLHVQAEFLFPQRHRNFVLMSSTDWARPTHQVEGELLVLKMVITNFIPPFLQCRGHCFLCDSTITQPLQKKEQFQSDLPCSSGKDLFPKFC